MRRFQVVAIGDGDAVFAGQHPLVAFQQQRFGLGVFLLSRKARAQEAAGAESPPVIGLDFLLPLQGFARQRLALGELVSVRRLRASSVAVAGSSVTAGLGETAGAVLGRL